MSKACKYTLMLGGTFVLVGLGLIPVVLYNGIDSDVSRGLTPIGLGCTLIGLALTRAGSKL